MELIKYFLILILFVFIAGIVFNFLIKVGLILLIVMALAYLGRKLFFE